MSRIKLLLDVVNGMRTLADSLETMANAIADGDNNIAKEKISEQKGTDKPSVTYEQLRELAVRLSRAGKRDEIKKLLEKYGVRNITAVAETNLESFYADLKLMEVG